MSQVTADHGHGGHDEHGHHDPHVAHHFDSAGQQFSSGKLGMWLFLATEVLFFGGLFTFYSVWRANHPEIFEIGSTALDWKLGALNTVVLILSSFTMAWGVTAAQQGKIKLLKLLLLITIGGGAVFMVIKAFEYNAKFEHGYLWGDDYTGHLPLETHGADDAAHGGAAATGDETHAEESSASAGEGTSGATEEQSRLGWGYDDVSVQVPVSTVAPAASGPSGLARAPTAAHANIEPKNVSTYFSIYFCLTGLHGIHVLIGMGLIFWIWLRTRAGEFGTEYFTPVDLVGLYWHLVDLIWIFLFPLLYLI